MRPKLSVIVPTHRRPDLLREALASLRSQQGADWEALVVDDGGPETQGVRVVMGLADPRIVAFRNPGRGQVDARNAGIRAATGEVIVWLDDDDLLADPGHLALVAAAHRARPALLWRFGWMQHPGGGRAPWDLAADAASLRCDNTLLTSGTAYPAELHDRLGMLDPELGGYFDWDWYLRAVDAGTPLRQLPGRGAVYRWSGDSASASLDAERWIRFSRLRRKHGLVTRMKNHRVLLEERSGVEVFGGVPKSRTPADRTALAP